MSGWQDLVLRHFQPDLAKLFVVSDPDRLLLEERLAGEIRRRGFHILNFEDNVSFRYIYESEYKPVGAAVIVRYQGYDLSDLPYDIVSTSKQYSITLGDLLPDLSYPVVAALDTTDLDSLYKAQQQHASGKLGDNLTKDFILRHVFGVAAELVKTPADLLRVLLRWHYNGKRVPNTITDRFINVLRQAGAFVDWPLEQIVPEADMFYAFLQERWPAFVRQVMQEDGQSNTDCIPLDAPELSGPMDIPFDHDDVHVYIDNLFTEGYLQPIVVGDATLCANLTGKQSWISVGVNNDQGAHALRRLHDLISAVCHTVPGIDGGYQDWLLFAHRWAELLAIRYSGNYQIPEDQLAQIKEATSNVDDAFNQWMLERYVGLQNQPPSSPAMVHHIPRYLARRIESSTNGRVALVILDGMAYDQWVTIREVLLGETETLSFRESAVFAWVPTVTPVSRQALLAGKPPRYFPSTIGTTNAEAKLWQQFWSDEGVSNSEVVYLKSLGEEHSLELVSDALSHPKARVAALIVDKIDKIMHGMELGSAGMHNQVSQWSNTGFLIRLLRLIHKCGFEAVITSDHGNIEAKGIGRLAEGSVADVRGERVRVYPDHIVRSSMCNLVPGSIEWSTTGLPGNYMPLMAPARSAFVQSGDVLVSHGGIAIEEVIVPLVDVKWRY